MTADGAPDHWGAGAGSALLRAAHGALAALGHAHAVLWVVPSNTRARRLYERHGWHDDEAERVEDIGGTPVPACRYRRALVDGVDQGGAHVGA